MRAVLCGANGVMGKLIGDILGSEVVGRVSIDGENVPFTKTEFELLRLLLEEKGRVFSRQELIDRVWPKDVLVLDRTVDVNITRMRKKIGKFAKCIVTRLGFGYYFDA